jgi:DNA-binding response OmpR family regulator
MSGYPTTETLKVAKDLGAVAFIAKPFTPDELLEAVKAVIQEGERH